MTAPADLKTDFMKLEYAAVLDKITATRADIVRTETVYPLAIVALYAWMLTHPAGAPWLWRVAMSLPSAIAVLGVVRLRGRLKSMRLLEEYCCRIEFEFYQTADWGWEHTYALDRPMHGVGRARWCVGIGFVFLTLVVAGWAIIVGPPLVTVGGAPHPGP